MAATPEPHVGSQDQDLWPDLGPLLDEELSRLPDKYRVAVVFCDLQGKTRAEAEATVTNCFLKGNMNLLMQLADERKITVTDQQAMRKIGEEVGMQLMRRNCDAFVQLSMKMAQESNGERTSFSKTSGTLSAVETKDFCKLILTESNGKKSSFYWLHHFTNSEKFVGQPAKYIGKKVKITWEDTEVYLPAMKDYFKIKEIKEIELL